MTTSSEAHAKNLQAKEGDGVQCQLDDVWVHSIPSYLKVAHPTVTVEDYRNMFGADAPLVSARLEAAKQKRDGADGYQMNAASSAQIVRLHPEIDGDWNIGPPSQRSFSDVFGLGEAKAALNKQGKPIMIEVLGAPGDELRGFVPEVDNRYIFNIDLLKTVMMAFQLRIPILLWGKHGTGKTSQIEQYCAHTNRPHIRIQHTASTEEAHVLGQYILKDGATVFEPGPLAIAMRYGLTYIADEYDFAMPNVTAVYQPVLEGKALIIKEAPREWRVVRPHPNFRFAATGNTNGGGDETGLYQGTQIQNAANYSRFGITVEVGYMTEKQESAIVASQGQIHIEDAGRLVKIGNSIRDSYSRGDIGVTVSPRELINAATLGRTLGGEWKQGLALAFTNRLNTVDRQAVMQLSQRYFAD